MDHTDSPAGEQEQAVRVGSYKGKELSNRSSPAALWLSVDSEAATMTGPENPHTLLPTTNCFDSRRIAAMESNKEERK